MRSGEEIQAALRRFVSKWEGYQGSERSEAQTFVNDLFACYGSDRREVGAGFEDDRSTGAGIMDLHWQDVVLMEMKAPSQARRLSEHRKQALDYWHDCADVATDRSAPRYVVLCAFHRFEVWEPGRFPNAPRAEFSLAELPDRYESLLFLTAAGDEALFGTVNRELTTEATRVVADLYDCLMRRGAAPSETIQAFVLQLVWYLFAEDYGMVSGHATQHLVKAILDNPYWTSYMMLGGLFESLNDPTDYGRRGVLAGTRYVNGELFARPAKVHLEPEELRLIMAAAEYQWRDVDPTIFGSLMEGFLARQRKGLGAHYTHEADIMKIVRPTIVRPWRERVDSTSTPAEAQQLLEELCRFQVLDPACGCGNFLYLAYRELRALESELKQRITSLARQTGLPTPEGPLPYYPLANLHGIDIEPVVTQIARVTLWMGHRQMADRYGAAEPVLPLVELSTVKAGDALAMEWPEVDCIIGNPPFHGSQHLREALGDDYLTWLKRTFNVGIKDYCVYWFRKAQDHLTPGQRAGLVGTNSVSQNRARSSSLEYIIASGGVITDAVSTQKWPGEAKVHVSLVNWIKQPAASSDSFSIDGEPVSGITAELRPPERSTGEIARLNANKGCCFQGPIPVGEGFIISVEEAAELIERTDADYRRVVRPYVTGDDIADDPAQRPRRWIIDFAQLPLEAAMRYPAALEIVKERVRPKRAANNRKLYRERWWQFGEGRPGMRKALSGLPRYVAGVAQGKRLLFSWCEAWTCPSNLTYVFALGDDYSMGLLSSLAHGAWARARASTLKGDIRYTPTTVFEMFPWPHPITDEQRERVAEASRRIIARRQEVCAKENIGLTRLYNLVDEGAYVDLRKLHTELDDAVAAAYGWPKSIIQDRDEIVRLLLRLNREIAAGERPYHPFETSVGQHVTQTLDFDRSELVASEINLTIGEDT